MTSLAAFLANLAGATPGGGQSRQPTNAAADDGLFASLLAANGESAGFPALSGLRPAAEGTAANKTGSLALTAANGEEARLSEGLIERLAAMTQGLTAADLESMIAENPGLPARDLVVLAALQRGETPLSVRAALEAAGQRDSDVTLTGTSAEETPEEPQSAPLQETSQQLALPASNATATKGQATSAQAVADSQNQAANGRNQSAIGHNQAAAMAHGSPDTAVNTHTPRLPGFTPAGLETALAHASETGAEKGLQTALARAGQGTTRGDGTSNTETRESLARPVQTAASTVKPGTHKPVQAGSAQTATAPGVRAATVVKQLVNPATGQTLIQLHERAGGDKGAAITADSALNPVNVQTRAAPPGPPPGQAPQVPVSALAVHIAQQAQNGVRRFDIRLDPPELGSVKIRLDVTREGHVTTHLVVERTETLDLLQRDARHLERALQDAGLDTSRDGLKFSLKDQGFAQGRARDGGAENGKVPPEGNANDEPSTAENEAGTETARRYIAAAGVDIRI